MENESPKIPRIGIDIMGSDNPPEEILADLIPYSAELFGSAQLHIFATEEVFNQTKNLEKIVPHIVTDVIEMDESPIAALRKKRGAPMCVGIQKMAGKELDAFISAGNTGALFGAAQFFLPRLAGIARPGLLLVLPTEDRPMAVCDVGANPNWKSKNLVQYASIGVAYQKAFGVKEPKVGLLNIGVEAIKGTPELIKVYEKLQTLNTNRPEDSKLFLGNIEGKDAFRGNIDVLVTDGFTGNIFLKTSEGICRYLMGQLERTAGKDCTPYFKDTLDKLRKHLSVTEYPGALLAGVDGIVVKCHGDSTADAFGSAIRGSLKLIENRFLDKVKEQLQSDQRLFKLSN